MVAIVNFRSSEMAIDAIQSLAADSTTCKSIRVVVGDAASGDGSVERLREAVERNGWADWCEVRVLERNGGFAYANNATIGPVLASEDALEYVLLLNPDTIVRPGAVETLVRFMDARPEVGICGSRLEYPDGSTQFAARRFPGVLSELESMLRFGPASRLLRRWRIIEPESVVPHPTDWLPGASLMIRREVFEQIGLLDEGYFMYFEEVDFCLRAKRAGWEVWYVPQSRVVHLVGQSSGVTSERPRRRPQYWYDSRRRYFEKNYGRWKRVLADAAFLTGLAGWRVRRAVTRQPDPDPPHLMRDFLRHAFTGALPKT